MAMLIYTTGNGYYCCCRQTSQDYTHFDSDDIDSLIDDCISIAKSSDWDFGISTIEGYVGDADELEAKITQAISDAKDSTDKQRKINSITDEIKSIDRWFDTLDQAKLDKQATKEKLMAQLAELKG